MNNLVRCLISVYILLLSHSAYAFTDACWLIEKMISSGANVTIEKYKGWTLEGNGYFLDERSGWNKYFL